MTVIAPDKRCYVERPTTERVAIAIAIAMSGQPHAGMRSSCADAIRGELVIAFTRKQQPDDASKQ